MKILGIDTTTKFMCLGVYDTTRIYEYNLETGKLLSSLLGLTIKRVLDALGWQAKDIDYFACGLGPGSFTGTRIGVSTIKGLSVVGHKPVIGISSLDILAKNAPDTKDFIPTPQNRPAKGRPDGGGSGFRPTGNPCGLQPGRGSIMPIIDAKRGLIYTSIYKEKNGRLLRTGPYMLLDKNGLFKKAKGDAVMLGDAAGLYREAILMHVKGANILDKDYWYPQGRNIITLALERIRDKKFDSPSNIKPIYLYPKECQIKSV